MGMVMNKQEIYEAIKRGWETLRFTRFVYLKDEQGCQLIIEDGVARDMLSHYEKIPTCACAVGAFMFDQKLDVVNAATIMVNAGISPTKIESLSDACDTKELALVKIRGYLEIEDV
jgi:hypothetical protein